MATSTTPVPADVMAALWRGDTALARSLTEKLLAANASRRQALELELAALADEQSKLQAFLASAPIDSSRAQGRADKGPTQTKGKASPSNSMSPEQRQARADAVVKVAIALAKQSGGTIEVHELAEKLVSAGQDLGVPAAAVRTTVGNILFRSPLFRRLTKGSYRLKPSATSGSRSAKQQKVTVKRKGSART